MMNLNLDAKNNSLSNIEITLYDRSENEDKEISVEAIKSKKEKKKGKMLKKKLRNNTSNIHGTSYRDHNRKEMQKVLFVYKCIGCLISVSIEAFSMLPVLAKSIKTLAKVTRNTCRRGFLNFISCY